MSRFCLEDPEEARILNNNTEDFKGKITNIVYSLQKSRILLPSIPETKYSILNLTDDIAVRFAKNKTVIPNMELKFCPKNKIHELALKTAITVELPKAKLMISNLELQIAFKEIVLKSPKDLGRRAPHTRCAAPVILE